MKSTSAFISLRKDAPRFEDSNFEIVENGSSIKAPNSFTLQNIITRQKFTIFCFQTVETIDKLESALKILAEMDHPVIHKVYGYMIETPEDTNIRQVKIVTQCVDCFPLRNLISGLHREKLIVNWSPTQKMNIIFGIASAMMYLQGNQFIMRNLSSTSIYIQNDFRPILTNFQLLKFENSTILIPNNKNVQHPVCVAPELLQKIPYTKRVDVFSYGTILYELLSTSFPSFSHSSICPNKLTKHQIAEKLVNGQRPIIPNVIPESYKKLITKCWSQDGSKRPSFKEIVRLLLQPEYLLPGVNIEEFQSYVNTVISHRFLQNPPYQKGQKRDLSQSITIRQNISEECIEHEEKMNQENQMPKNNISIKSGLDIIHNAPILMSPTDQRRSSEEISVDLTSEDDYEKSGIIPEYANASIISDLSELSWDNLTMCSEIEPYEKYELSSVFPFDTIEIEQSDKSIDIKAMSFDELSNYITPIKIAAESKEAGPREWLKYAIALKEINPVKSEEFYEKAATVGDEEALIHIAVKQWNKDKKIGRQLLEKIIENGNIKASLVLGYLLFIQNPSVQNLDAEKFLKIASDKENDKAQNMIGILLMNRGSYEEAVKHFIEASKRNNACSICNLATLYRDGKGIKADMNIAETLYKQASDLGNAVALNNYGWFLMNKSKKKSELNLAYELFKKSAELGNDSGQNNYGTMLEFGVGISPNYEEALINFQKAYDQGNTNAMINLGFMHLKGMGTEKSIQKANDFFKLAKDHGNLNGSKYYDHLRSHLATETYT